MANGVAPGGFNPAFDLLEINESAPEDDDKVIHALWNYWTQGRRYYLGAGTDTHDVWNSVSGEVRTYAHLTGPVSATTYAEALKAGHGYVTHGPLIFPAVMFGDELRVAANRSFELGFDFESVTGLKSVQLIGGGKVQSRRAFPGSPHEAHVDFPLRTRRDTWYAVVVEDARGQRAFTDPTWVRTRP